MIHPVFQRSELSGKSISFVSLNLSGNYEKFLSAFASEKGLVSDKNGYNVFVCLDRSASFRKAENIPGTTDEKYVLDISEEKTVITCSSKRGAFYALNSLLKLNSSGELRSGTVTDYPLFAKRGYIEGFYGKTWPQKKRESVMRLMAENGMNTFYYAPKDDIYHREKWSEPYPEKDLKKLKRLFALSKKLCMDFFWCVGPGLTYHYTSDSDFIKLINKYKSLADAGIKNFGLLLDDIPWDFQYDDDAEKYSCIAEAHVELVNRTYAALKDYDKDVRLTVCPTQYSGDENGEYISSFGKGIPSDVGIFWTGEEICSRVLRKREADELVASTSHKVLFWDNFPVNDCEMFREMHLGALIGRDKDLYLSSEGLISNVMEYAECSKIPLLTIADYLWNPLKYDPSSSLENAHRIVLKEKAEKFALFADHTGVSCLSKYSSAYMSDTLAHIAFLESHGKTDEAYALFEKYNNDMRECFDMMQDKKVPLFAELSLWTKKFGMCCDLLDMILLTRRSPSDGNRRKLKRMLDAYNADSVILTGFCLREAAEKTLAKK